MSAFDPLQTLATAGSILPMLHRLASLLLVLVVVASCDRSHRAQAITVEGVASVGNDGAFEVLDLDKQKWFGVYPGTAKIPPEIAGFRGTYKDRCWIRIFRVRVRGTPFADRLLMATSVDITRRYSDAEVPVLLERIQFEPLKGKHTCGSY